MQTTLKTVKKHAQLIRIGIFTLQNILQTVAKIAKKKNQKYFLIIEICNIIYAYLRKISPIL